MKRIVGLLLLGVVALVGCATSYQRMGTTGGYSENRVDANTFLVEFRGNGYTPRQSVETYLLHRCAEVTAEAGYDYFVIIGGGIDSYTVLWAKAYGGSYRIQVFRGEKPANDPIAYDAHEVLKNLGPSINK
jgi:hypothetical protein